MLASLVSCASRPGWHRNRYYATSSDEVARSVEAVLRELGYQYVQVGDGRPDYRVGPFWYGAGHRPIDPPAGRVPDGTERADLWVGVGGKEKFGYFLHVRGVVYRYRGGKPVLQHPNRPPGFQRSHQEVRFNSTLAAVVDPVFVKVYERLKASAVNPP
ncbi:MAG: hypothetical protein IPL61_27340 [Myxococcales bacterium]|nr:hypothetical protein [Myxococcales bacterium]